MCFNYAEIQEKFNRVISKTQQINIEDVNTDVLFAQWWDNKKELYKKFGEKLIVESSIPIEIQTEEKQRTKIFENFKDYIIRIFDYDNDLYENLLNFLYDQKNSFFQNKVENVLSYYPEKITKGMKISKAIKYFIDSNYPLTCIQEEYSRILQSLKITGTLCLSIHPLDYLSVSENNNNWRSCHALDGEYRSGNLNYMADSTTIVAYLKGNKDEPLNGFQGEVWNSKKWRTLIFTNKNNTIIAMGRHYPFFIPGIFPHLNNLMEESCIINNNMSAWEECFKTNILKKEFRGNSIETVETELEYPYALIYKNFVSMRDIVKENYNHLFYNDILYSTCYTPFIKRGYFYGIDYFKNFPITIGEDVKCLCCGERLIEDNDLMVCPECALTKTTLDSDRFFTCPMCGRREWREDGCWVVTGEDFAESLVCRDCYENSKI